MACVEEGRFEMFIEPTWWANLLYLQLFRVASRSWSPFNIWLVLVLSAQKCNLKNKLLMYAINVNRVDQID